MSSPESVFQEGVKDSVSPFGCAKAGCPVAVFDKVLHLIGFEINAERQAKIGFACVSNRAKPHLEVFRGFQRGVLEVLYHVAIISDYSVYVKLKPANLHHKLKRPCFCNASYA